MTTPKLIGISGSLRAGSFSTAILEGLKDALAGKAELNVYRLNDLPFYNQDVDTETPPAAVADFRAAIAAADGVIVASPEYNFSMSGVIKNAIDWASRPYGKGPIRGKPTLVITSSPGSTGGLRAQAPLRETLYAAGGLVVHTPHIAIAGVADKVKDGKLVEQKALDFALGGIDALLNEIRVRKA
ncbi:NAD(P)H-dependent oxidoreductase [Ancylobacter sp. 6x-1]|uniref:NAD(P)H-dependent oxidoreductase n=1 Tax=Ancylobacter crimeensis TaxID=2579147 RepID=A0ABT0D8T6_9HYPH|nr:NAD(P)H-dependent oxidoreductase [Ancylobacter crimeensis]MCK0196363.1 NAD(P)H-dependent oxidoreductase [Ancylobacter crimeensis]